MTVTRGPGGGPAVRRLSSGALEPEHADGFRQLCGLVA
ncbi:hypothetical protein BLAT2472_30571 [Burkholderia latens]